MEKQKTIIVDIDGTLAHMNGRGPFDWDYVDKDTCDELVKGIVYSLADGNDYKVILVSGRSDICLEKTVNWLLDNKIYYYKLFMRPDGDFRPDTELKEEIYKKFIEPNYEVVAVFDDRPKVIAKWRELGLRVIDVGNGVDF